MDIPINYHVLILRDYIQYTIQTPLKDACKNRRFRATNWRSIVFGIASMELSWAYVLCIFASFICVVYGIVKWNSTGPTSGELKNEAEPEKLKQT